MRVPGPHSSSEISNRNVQLQWWNAKGVYINRDKSASCLNEAALFVAHVTTHDGNVSQERKGKHIDGVRIIVGELRYESRFLHPACSSKPTAEVNSIFHGLEQGQVR